jgi:alkylation response protein AidB-like acyl-CoA dehydrogenase
MKDKYGFEQRKTYAESPLGFSDALWGQYAELGLLGAPFSEEDGGYGAARSRSC